MQTSITPEMPGSLHVLELKQPSETQPPTLNGAGNGHFRCDNLAIACPPSPASRLAPVSIPEISRQSGADAQPDAPLLPDLPPPVLTPRTPSPNLPALTSSPPPPPILKGRPRAGAVAGLPKDERNMVCRMINQSVPYKRIVEALGHLGFVLSERNISNWVTHGGYAEWCVLTESALQTSLRQDDLLEHHRNENSPDLAEVGLQAAAVRLSELILHQMSSNQPLDGQLSKLEPVINLLCRIGNGLFTFQKYRDDCQTKIFKTPARIKAEQQHDILIHEAVYSAEFKPDPPATPTPAASQPPAPPAPAPAQPHASPSSPDADASPAVASIPQTEPPQPATSTSPEPLV